MPVPVSDRHAEYAGPRPGFRWVVVPALLLFAYPLELVLRRGVGVAYLSRRHTALSLGLLGMVALVSLSPLLLALTVAAGVAWRRHTARARERAAEPGGDRVPPLYPGTPRLGGPAFEAGRVLPHHGRYRLVSLGEGVLLLANAEVAHALGDGTAFVWFLAAGFGLFARTVALWRRQSERTLLAREVERYGSPYPLHLPLTPPALCPPPPRVVVSLPPTSAPVAAGARLTRRDGLAVAPPPALSCSSPSPSAPQEARSDSAAGIRAEAALAS